MSLVSKIKPRNLASLTTFIGIFPRKMLGSGGKKSIVGESGCRLSWGGELKAVLRHPLLNAVNTQLHSTLHCLTSFSSHTVIHKQGAIHTLQNSFNDVVNAEQGWRQDATLWDPHLLLMQLQQSGTHSNLKGTLAHKKVDKPGEGAQLCCDWQCTEYDSVHYCVLLLFLLKFQVLKFAECYVRMWLIKRFMCVILKGLLCCTLPEHFQVSALYTSLFLLKPSLLVNFYSVGITHVEFKRVNLILLRSMFRDLRPLKRGQRGGVRLTAKRRKYWLPLP